MICRLGLDSYAGTVQGAADLADDLGILQDAELFRDLDIVNRPIIDVLPA